MSQLKLKVCGMKAAENIQQLIDLRPDFMGFIFYKKSPRYVGELGADVFSRVPISIKKVGVFVNEEIDTVLELYEKYGLDYVQLHGDEDLEYSMRLKTQRVKIIKVFRILDSLPYSIAKFSEYSDYFLFDTATKSYGGSGRHFDWSILKNYSSEVPFLLSGGISTDDVGQIKEMNPNGLAGIDVNSRFEVEPGLKDIEMVRKLKTEL